jgi:hypothetical protein
VHGERRGEPLHLHQDVSATRLPGGLETTLQVTYRHVDLPLLEKLGLNAALGRNLVLDVAQVLDLVVHGHLEHGENSRWSVMRKGGDLRMWQTFAIGHGPWRSRFVCR